jgi:lipopolysaccharide export LptBFGC system permease protein LptF
LRVGAPIVFAGVGLSFLLWVDQEYVIPQMIPRLVRSHEDIHAPAAHTYAVQMLDPASSGAAKNALFMAARYVPAAAGETPSIRVLDVIERDDDLTPRAHLYADSAVWNAKDKRWDLTNGRRVRILKPDETHPLPEQPVEFYKGGVTPDEIQLNRSGDYVNLLKTERIDELISRPGSYGVRDLQRVKHIRFTQLLINPILLLLAVPCVLTRDPGQLKSAAMKCLGLTGACMTMVFVSYQMAGHPPIGASAEQIRLWSMAMAWMPVFVFGPLSFWLLERVKT